MLFSQDELNKIYIDKTIEKIFNQKTEKFKNTLPKLNISSQIYKYKDFDYIYGFSEGYGYYLIAIDENKDGFMWIKPPIFKDNENGLFYGTKKFKYLSDYFYNIINLSMFREIYIRYIRHEEMEQNIQSFFSVVFFRSFPWFRKFNRKLTSKIILVYLFSIIYEFKNEVDILNKETRDLSLNSPESFHNADNIIKASTFTGINIDKILKHEISFTDIINYIY